MMNHINKLSLFYFATIGLCASTVHLLVVLFLVSTNNQPPLIANIIAFIIAFQVSFLGHKHYTFYQLTDSRRLKLPHFFIVAVSAGVLNEFLYYLFLHCTSLNYFLSLIIVMLLVSFYTFSVTKFWACR